MRRCVIVGGAPIERAEELRAYLRADDYMIYCDCGLRHEKALGRAPDLIVGDFDSHEDPHAAAETIVLPLLGMTGARLDHTLGNLALLRMLEGAGAKALLVDDYSETEIVSGEAAVADEFPYFSLLPLGGAAKGVCVTDAKFPLRGASLEPDSSLGVSNEPLPGKIARIRAGEGKLLLVRVKRG